PMALRGDMDIVLSESLGERLQRQAAENLLLQHFGLSMAGFAPSAARHPSSMFPLLFEAAQRKLTAELGRPPSSAETEALLERLAVDATARETFAPFLVGVVIKALQVPPHEHSLHPAARALQEQFAKYYTNQRRRAADRTYTHWDRYRCGLRQGLQNSTLGSVLGGAFVSRGGFDGLKDPMGLGALGAAKLERYDRALRSTYDPNSPALSAAEKGTIAGLALGLPIYPVAGFLASVHIQVAANVALNTAFDAAAIKAGGVVTASSAKGIAGTTAPVAGTVATVAIVGLMWVGAGFHIADIATTDTWENRVLREREDTSSEDPNVLRDEIRLAFETRDDRFLGELLLIALKMIVVEPARLARDTGGASNISLINGPVSPPDYGMQSASSESGSAAHEPRLITLDDGSQAWLVTTHGLPDFWTDVPEMVVTLDDSLDGLPIIPGCGNSPGPDAAYAELPSFLHLHTGYGGPSYQPLVFEPPPYLGPVHASATPSQAQWVYLDRAANDVAIGADGEMWHLGTDVRPYGHSIYRRTAAGDWEQMPGEATRIAVGSKDHVAVVNSAHDIFRWTGQGWQQLPGKAHDIGMAQDGGLWVIGADARFGGYGIYQWTNNGWRNIPGAAVKIDVGPGQQAVVVNDSGAIYRWSGAQWIGMPGRASDVAMGSDGGIWMLGTLDGGMGGYSPYRWTGQDWQIAAGLGLHISAQHGRSLVMSNQLQSLFETRF
ncbi:MAG: hypothetical protein KDK91_02615, partial [Gammaproteobacteria bacterium]|nr:hypothetical protein [Gammaproteobacteria bacterium]